MDEPDVITSSVSSGFLCLVSTASDTSKPQLVPHIRSHKLWFQTRALLSPVFVATKMLASKFVYYFSSHPVAFGFWSSTPPDNITLHPANKEADQSLLAVQTCIGVAAHVTLDIEQLISHSVTLVDTIFSLQDSEGRVIPVSEWCELLSIPCPNMW